MPARFEPPRRDQPGSKHRSAGGPEAWVENIVLVGDGVEVTLSLADGRLARSFLQIDRADWLELRIGQIVTLAPPSPGHPGGAVVCQGVDLGWELICGNIGQAD